MAEAARFCRKSEDVVNGDPIAVGVVIFFIAVVARAVWLERRRK